MKKLLLMLSTVVIGFAAATAQSQLPRCGFDYIIRHNKAADPTYADRMKALIHQPVPASKGTSVVYHIPVVFHVVYFNAAGNVPDSVLHNQIAVLNGAYRKAHADTGTLRDIFKPIAADAEIEFYLAGIDPSGNPTSGITRTATTIDGFGDLAGLITGDLSSIERIKHTALGGEDSWDPAHYLNVWVADMSIPGIGPAILGIATPPLNPLPPVWGTDTTGWGSMGDGVTVQYQCVGNNNPQIADLAAFGAGTAGRTAVHEIGHYLGLRHIWGDAAGTADECMTTGDDGLGDTPAQADASAMGATCPDATQNTCGSGTPGDMPDLWENYMDYSRDNCQDMFTFDQVALMRGVAANQRDTLTDESIPAGIAQADPALHSVIIYPQPANGQLTIGFEGNIDELTLSNVMGQEVKAWTNLSQSQRTLSIADLPAGNYFLHLKDGSHTYNKQVLIGR